MGSPCAQGRPQASPGPLFSSSHRPISAPGSWTDRVETQTYLGAASWGEPHSKKSSISSLSLFPYLGGERQLEQVLCPSTSSPASCLSLDIIPPGAHGPGQYRGSAFTRAWTEQGLGSWPRVPRAETSLPLSHTHLGLVSMLMYLRSSAAYWAICSGVALSPGYTGSSGAPSVPSGGCSNRATHVDRSSRERQQRVVSI